MTSYPIYLKLGKEDLVIHLVKRFRKMTYERFGWFGCACSGQLHRVHVIFEVLLLFQNDLYSTETENSDTFTSILPT